MINTKVEKMEDELSPLTRIALVMYVGEKCRVCGKESTKDEVFENKIVYAGYAKNAFTRTAHRDCFDKVPKKNWMFWEDDK